MKSASLQLLDFVSAFSQDGLFELPEYQEVGAREVPEPYGTLLVHQQHMTVALERYHGGRIDLRVLASRHLGNLYSRLILLGLEQTDQIVQFGIMRIDLDCCDEAVRSEILEAKTPLGRILIEHNVLREIKPYRYLRIVPNDQMCGWFGLRSAEPTYGRLGNILYNAVPAVEVLEVVRPEKPLTH